MKQLKTIIDEDAGSGLFLINTKVLRSQVTVHPVECELCNGTLMIARETARDSEKVEMTFSFCPRIKKFGRIAASSTAGV